MRDLHEAEEGGENKNPRDDLSCINVKAGEVSRLMGREEYLNNLSVW